MRDSLSVVLKDPDDRQRARGPWLELLLQAAQQGAAAGPAEWERAASALAAAPPAPGDGPAAGGAFAPGSLRPHGGLFSPGTFGPYGGGRP